MIDMKKQEIIEELKKIKWSLDEYMVIGGTAMVLLGVKKSTDTIEIAISKSLFKSLENDLVKSINYDNVYLIDNMEIHLNDYKPKYKTISLGIPVMNINGLTKLNSETNNLKDMKLLDEFNRKSDNLSYEKELYKKGFNLIAGVDEVGRGPLVGPVVASAVILPKNYKLKGLTDSKKLSEKKRDEYYKIIMRDAISVGIGIIDAKTIDEVNIYEASKLAMIMALNELNVKPDYVLTDAMKLNIAIPYIDIIRGDSLSLSISAASVIAKVTRDKMMYELDSLYPMYGFKNHKGYPTKEHIENLVKYGILDNYRMSYKPICDIINERKKENVHA